MQQLRKENFQSWNELYNMYVGRAVALVLKGNNYKCILFDDGFLSLVYI